MVGQLVVHVAGGMGVRHVARKGVKKNRQLKILPVIARVAVSRRVRR